MILIMTFISNVKRMACKNLKKSGMKWCGVINITIEAALNINSFNLFCDLNLARPIILCARPPTTYRCSEFKFPSVLVQIPPN